MSPSRFATTIRFPDRILSMMALRMILWVAVAAFTSEGILSDPFKVAEWMDDHQFYGWEESDRLTLLQYHQLPAWNPFWCGGTVGIAGPEDPFLGPDFLLRLIYGVAHGRRLAVFLLVILGFEGMYRLCRRLDSSAIASIFAAIAYGTCDRFISFLHDGWVNFMGFELIPMVLYFLVVGAWGPAGNPAEIDPATRRRRTIRARLIGAFFVAWIILAAGTYPTPYAMLSVGYVTIALSIYSFFNDENELPESTSRWRRSLGAPWLVPWIAALTIGVVALGFSAGKMLPTLSFLRQFPRVFTPVETHQPGELFGGFWGHYGLVLVLALIGTVTADLAAGVFLGGGLMFFALALGDYGPSSLFHLMKSLPILGQLRFPDRFMVGVLLFTSVSAARGITRVEDLIPNGVKRAWEMFFAWRGKNEPYPVEIGWGMVALAAFLAYSKLVRPNIEEIANLMHVRPGTMYVQEGPRNFEGPFKQSRGNRRDAHIFPAANMGSLYCVSGNPLPESALLRGDLPQEEYPEDPAAAKVERLEWTPNKITLSVDAKQATTIRVNQNWAAQWTSNIGTVKSVEKLLAVDVPAGQHTLVLAYKDRFLDFCLLISLATLLGVSFVIGRDVVRAVKREVQGWDKLPVWPGQPPKDVVVAKEPDELEGPPEPPESE